MERKSIVLMSLLTLVSSAMMEASAPAKPISNRQRKQLEFKARKAQEARMNAKPSLSSATHPIVAPIATQTASTSSIGKDSIAPATVEKTPFVGFWSRRPIISYLINWGHVPTYQRALEEAESFDSETQVWQNDDASKLFIEKALRSFKGRNVPIELNKFLVLADKKGIPLTSLEDTRSWIKELSQTETDQKKDLNDCLSMIGKIKSVK